MDDDQNQTAETVWRLRLETIIDRAMSLDGLLVDELAEVGRAAVDGLDPEERSRLAAVVVKALHHAQLQSPSAEATSTLREEVLSIAEVAAFRLQVEAAARRLISPPYSH